MKGPSKTNQELIEEVSALRERIKELESHLQSISRNLPIAMLYQVVAGEDGTRKFTYLSDSVRQLYGISPEEGMADPSLIYKRIHKDDIELLERAEARALRTLSNFKAEVRVTDPSGELRWSAFASTPSRAEDGSACWDGIEVIITERKRAEEALRESERRLSEAQRIAQLGHWIWDIRTGEVEWSEEVFRIFHLDPDSFVPRIDSILALSPWPEDHERDKELIRRAMESRERGSYEQRFLRPDKSIGYYVSSFQGKYDDDGSLISIVGTVQDITERKQAEEALKSSEEKYRLVFDNANDAIFIHDEEGRILTVNDLAVEHLGYTREELMSMRADQVDAPEQRRYTPERIARLMETGSLRFETVHQRRDGSLVPTEVSSRRIEWKGKQAVISICRDVTERKRMEEGLRASEKKYRSVIENIQDVFYRSDAGGFLLMGSPSGAWMFGYDTVDEMIGLHLDAVWPDAAARRELLDQVRAKGSVKDFEAVLRRKDGTLFNASFTTHFYYDDNGNLLGTEGLIRDITERKKAEEALHASHRRVLDIIEFLPDATFVIDHERKVVAWNRAIEEMTGVRKGDIIGKGDHAYAIPFYGEPRPILIDGVFEEGEEGRKQYDHVERQGDILLAEVYAPMTYQGKGAYLSATASPLFDPQGNVVGAIESIRDISEQKRIAWELTESEERYRTAIENSDDGVTMIEDGRHFYVNRRLLEIFGFDRIDEMVGQPVGFMVHPDDLERVVDISRLREKNDGPPMRYEYRGIKRNGDVVFIEASATRTIYKGEPISLVYLRDVTARKGLEGQVRRSQNLESIGTLAGGIAHDFNNLLMALTGNISLAKIHLSPGSQATRFLAEAERISLSGADLTNRLITFSKGGTPMRTVTSMNGMIRDEAHAALAGTKVRGEYSLPDALWPVKADERQMKQVIHNIVVNAEEAMPDGGTVRVAGTNITLAGEETLPLPPGDYVGITIEDHGTGIREEDLPKIFDPYFTTKGMGTEKGMGLGLAVVYSIIKRHNGHVSVDSVPGKGTAFHIYLPAHREEASTEPGKGSGPSRRRILLMDDEKIIRDVSEAILETLGFDAVLAEDGGKAVRLYRDARDSGEPFDAVILDLSVKDGMGGQEAMAELLSLDPQVKAIICTGYAHDPIVTNYDDYGFKGALTKPHKINDLKEALEKILPDPGEDA